MGRERYKEYENSDTLDASIMYDDIERLREREEEQEKNENNKLSFAGMMALVAGLGLLGVYVFSGAITSLISYDFMEFMNVILTVIGGGALFYGVYKTVKLAFRKKELNFPQLKFYRKRPKPKERREERRRDTDTNTNTKVDVEFRTDEPRQRYEYRRPTARENYDRRSSRRRRRQVKKSGQLSRSRRDKVFAGVAGGLSEYTGVSSGLIRFGFLISAVFTSGMSIFPYLFLSIILPQRYDYDRDDD